MTTNYTVVPKATSQTYTVVSKPFSNYTTVPKTVGTSYGVVPKKIPTITSTLSYVGGDSIGWLLALTYTTVTTSSTVSDGYTSVPKAISTAYTVVPKAT